MYAQAGFCYAFSYVFHAIIRQKLTLRKIGIFGCQGASANGNELKTVHLVRAYYDYSDSASICQQLFVIPLFEKNILKSE